MTSNLIQQESTTSSRFFVFGIFLLFRYTNAYFTRTYDNPDEYWQGQEVAHHMVFGNGYLTWEWREQIRSFAHPLSIAFVYKLIHCFGLENTDLFVLGPRYFQATLAAVADTATYTLAKRIMGNEIASSILFTSLCSWFNFFMAARTLSNSMEMVFTIVALCFWPLPGVIDTTANNHWIKHYRISLFLASMACIMRPTNGLIWLFLGTHLILTSGKKLTVILNAAALCFLVVAINCLIDTRIYRHGWSGQIVFTPYLFFKVNVVNSVSLFYGVHTWHWYLTQGLPVIFTTFIPFIAYGLYRIYNFKYLFQRTRSLLYLVAWIIFVYSLLPHKEFRFIFPIVPILLIISAYGLQQMKSPKWRFRSVLFLIITQIPMAVYLSVWHQRGVMDVMLWIRSEARQNNDMSVGVLMPCHSTPWYSVVHENIPMWFLTCEPPLITTDELDEADRFYVNPLEFIKTHQQDRQWPTTHLVLFDNLMPKIGDYLETQGFKECQRFFNSHFHDDFRRRGDVLVLCKT